MGNTGTTPRSSRGKNKQGTSKVEAGLVVERVAVDELRLWPDNPRIGDLGVITESLEINGQYRPLIVQRSSGCVIAGNHTLQGIQHLGWKECDVTYLDVDDTAAKRIMLVDNRSQDLADYDWDVLTEILQTVDSLVGTGFIQSELDALIKVQQELAEGDDEEWDEEDVEDHVFDDEEDLNMDRTVLRMNEDVMFLPTSDSNLWDIPELKIEMIPTVTDDIQPWVGPIISQSLDNGSNLFLYQYSTDSTREMPWERTIVGFYTQDERFENWWDKPEYYMTRMLNANIYALVVPDWSQYGSDPRCESLWNIYRSFWIGRFAQEAGVKVIPNLSTRGTDYDYSLAGVPFKAPTVAVQVQTTSNEADERHHARRIQKYMELIQPETMIVYAGPKGRAIAESVNPTCRMIYVNNRSTMKSIWQGERDQVLNGKQSNTK